MPFLINPFLGASGGPTFFPTDIAGLVRWYDADFYTGTFADGALITTPWDDFSVSAQDATPQAGQQPTFRNTVLADGKSSVEFINGFKHFDMTQLILGNYSVVVFFQPTSDAIISSGPPDNYQVREQAGGTLSDMPVLFHNAAPTLDHLGAHSTQVWHVRSWTRNGTTGVPFFYYNKIQEAESTGQTSTANMQLSTVGLSDGGPGAFHLAEFLIYNTVITQTDVDNLHDFYFALKYPGDL